ncbi:hypothetical protein BaRGS_00007125 [Batillaria attramentaria]|uniref:Uncharacterized protein n=1 Tax=Batillaria attramentaria TaxID=370345 RepID=A0ABD0LPT6_9CAEN
MPATLTKLTGHSRRGEKAIDLRELATSPSGSRQNDHNLRWLLAIQYERKTLTVCDPYSVICRAASHSTGNQQIPGKPRKEHYHKYQYLSILRFTAFCPRTTAGEGNRPIQVKSDHLGEGRRAGITDCAIASREG